MTILVNECLTLADLGSRMKDGNVIESDIVEMLSQDNEIMDDILFREGNLPTGHKTTIRTGLPEATWRKLYGGVKRSKSTTAQIVDTCGMLEAYSEVDKALADLNGNTKAFRYSEDSAFIETFNQGFSEALFYGDQAVNKERITGLTPRFNSLSADNKTNIINAGGTGAVNTSIWLVGWGEAGAMGIYPKGSKAGLQMQDLGQVTLLDDAGDPYEGYRSHFKWDVGFCLRDWQNVVRIANIDVPKLLTAGDGSADLSANILKMMSIALDKIRKPNKVKLAFYVTRNVKSMLKVKLFDKSNVFLTIGDYLNRQSVLKFQDIPIRVVDKLSETETRVI